MCVGGGGGWLGDWVKVSVWEISTFTFITIFYISYPITHQCVDKFTYPITPITSIYVNTHSLHAYEIQEQEEIKQQKE